MWIDTDVALGASRGDVDDGFALAAVALSPAVELRGVSVVTGNTNADTAYDCARRILDTLQVEATVVRDHDAPDAIAELTDTDILAIGPLTNIARAIETNDAFAARNGVRAVTTVHNRRRHPLLPFFDLNARTDPASFDRFMQAPFRSRRLYPLDVVQQLRFGKAELAELSNSPWGSYLAGHSQRWLDKSPVRYGTFSFPVWDLVPAMDVIGALKAAEFDSEQLVAFDAESTLRRFFDLFERV